MKLFKRKKKIAKKPLQQTEASICMKCGSVECAFCSNAVESAVELLKDKIHKYHEDTQDSIWDAVKDRYEREVKEIIESCFPVFYKKAKRKW